MNGLIGKKINQVQGFLEDGTRVPISVVSIPSNIVTQVKTQEKEGYNSIQVCFGLRKRTTKAIAGHIKKAGIEKTPRFLREIRLEKLEEIALGSEIKIEDVFKPGDVINVTGTSKGKGFAGGVKRYHFRGGPRTHGQSDRERAPGSIGQTTTPGRVYKGKKMAGHMGFDRVTVKNLMVLDINDGLLYVKGLIPGPKNTIVLIQKKGESKKFMPLYSFEDKKAEEVQESVESKIEETSQEVEEPKTEVETESGAAQEEVKEEAKPVEAEQKEETVVEDKVEVKEEEENAK